MQIREKISRWLDSIFNHTARKIVLALGDQAVISLSNFLAAIYLARNISATQFGVYAIGFLLLRFVRALQDGLIVQPLNALGAPLRNMDFRRFFSATILLQLLLTGFITAAAYIGGSILTSLGNDVAGPALSALWLVFLSWPLQELFRRVFYARGEIHLAALSSFLSNVIRFGYLVWCGSRSTLDGAAGLDAIAWGSVAGLVVGVWGSRSYFTRKIDRQWVRKTWGESWQFSRWTTGALLTHWVSLEVYPLVVAGMISFAAAGAYRALENLVAAVHVILRAMDTLITPVAARVFNKMGTDKLFQMLKRAYILGGIPIFIILIASLIFTAPLLNLLYGGEYLYMVDGIIWLVVFYVLWFTYWPVQSALKAIKHTRPLFNANLLAIICMFTLGILAVQTWGVKGAYLGQALNALITNVVLWRAWRKLIRGDFESLQTE